METRAENSRNRDLPPLPHRGRRIIVAIFLCIPVMLTSTTWQSKLPLLIMLVGSCGTYRRYRISPKSLKVRWTVFFVDTPYRQWKLRSFTRLDVKHAPQTTLTDYLMFGGFAFVLGPVASFVFPWMMGPFQIWLRDDSDRGVLAWQGNLESDFERNLEIVTQLTGLEIQAR